MRRITGLMAWLFVAALSGPAFSQVDCGVGGADCVTVKYGFGFEQNYRRDEFPPDAFRWTDINDFGPTIPTCSGGPTPGAKCSADSECGAGGTCEAGISYFTTRTGLAPNFGGTAGPDRALGPLPGMVFLRERTDCTPTSTGPTCTGGANAGQSCHLNAPPAVQPIECPDGTCTDNGGGCRVEIPLESADGGVSPTDFTSEVKIYATTYQGRNPFTGNLYDLTAQTGNTLGGTSDDSNPICPITNIRRKPSMATRYLLPPSHPHYDGSNTQTYIRWDSAYGITNPTGAGGCSTDNEAACDRSNLATNFRVHTDDTRLCCKPNVPGDCSALLRQNSAEYPLLTSRSCETSTRPFVNDDNIVVDWVFVGGRGTAFYTDTEFINPGSIPGVCKANRFQPCYVGFANSQCASALNPYACCTGAGTSDGTCDNICADLDADPDTPGLQPDTCDRTEPGFRVQVGCARDSEDNARRDCYGGSIYVLRAMPNRGCTLLPRRQYDGDPGENCAVLNYGIDHRYDDDCDGVEDHPDLCPFLNEWDNTADSDGDCSGGPGGACRGDECECGDSQGGGALPPGTLFQKGDGTPTVADLVAINIAIFNPLDSTKRNILMDNNNDIILTVSDIVGINKEIFTPDSSVCRQLAPRRCGPGVPNPCCGNGVLDQGEACDDVNATPGDGCNVVCRVEFGFSCSGEPSVCTPTLP